MRRPVQFTLSFIIRKYKKNKIAIETLTLRKQMCIAYLQWATRKTKKFGYAFYDLAKRWRKEECRYGGKRTRLEKISRKFLKVKREDLFRESRKPGGAATGKAMVKRRLGFFAPEN